MRNLLFFFFLHPAFLFFQFKKKKIVFTNFVLFFLFRTVLFYSGCTHFDVVIRRTIDYINSCSSSCIQNQLVAAERESSLFKWKCVDP